MKRKIFSVFFALVLVLSFSLVTAVPAGAVDPPRDRVTAITKAADWLAANQIEDGGFMWKQVVGGTSSHNLVGITAMGILKAHEPEDKDTYETALAMAYMYAVNHPPVYTWEVDEYIETTPKGVDSFPDITFLIKLAEAAATDATLFTAIVAEVPTTATAADIAALARTRWDNRILYIGSSTEATEGSPDGTATTYAEWLRDFRVGIEGIHPWDLEAGVKAGLALDFYYPGQGYAGQAAEIAEVLHDSLYVEPVYFNILEPAQTYFIIGISGALEAFVEVGLHLDKVDNLKAILLANQQEGGYWNYHNIPDEGDTEMSVQDTAYAVMALVRQGDDDAVIAARKGADWLVSSQLETGGWFWVDGSTSEYSELNSEAAWALATAEAPVTIGEKGYYSIQSAINSASPEDTIIVAAGTYNEVVTINKSLTLNGAKPGVDARTRNTDSGESILDGTGLTPVVGVGAFNIADGVSDVIIDGFEVCNYESINPGGGSAVLAYSYNATEGLSDITIQNNYMHDLGWNGVCVWSNNQVVHEDFTIQFNLIKEAPYAGIELTNVIDSKVLNNKVIAPTVIVDDLGDAGVGIEIAVRAQLGITITAGTDVLVEGNEISGTFAEGSRAAINILSRAYSSTSDATLTGVTVKSNTVSANVIVGILAVAESRDGTATISNLQIVDDNIVSNFTKGGIVVRDVLSVQIEGNIISTTDYTLAPNGIDIGATTGTTGTVNNNQVSGCQWSEYDPLTETYEDDWTASGILVIAPNSALEISGNEVQSCDVGLDIEAGSGTLVTNNDVHDNSYGFVLWNADTVINFNNIYQNALYGVYRTSDPFADPTGILNATNNYWGNASGPIAYPIVVGYESYGDKVYKNQNGPITYEPWLLAVAEVVPGVEPTTYEKTLALKKGWTLISTDKLVTTDSTWVGTEDLGTGKTVLAYEYTGVSYPVVDDPVGLKPIDALYVKTAGGGGVGINYSDSAPGVSSKELVAGWNLISSGTIADAGAVLSPLKDIATEGTGLTTVVSQGSYNQYTEAKYIDATAWLGLSWQMSPFDGYWIYMNAAKSFGVISD